MSNSIEKIPAPSWYGELLQRSVIAIDRLCNNEEICRLRLEGFMTEHMAEFSQKELMDIYWKSWNPAYPVADESMVSWLSEEAKLDGTSELLAAYALNPSWAGFSQPPFSWEPSVEDRAVYDAFRVLIRAAALNLPSNFDHVSRLKHAEYDCEQHSCREMVLEILTAGWSGVTLEKYAAPVSHAVHAGQVDIMVGWSLFKRLLSDPPLGDRAGKNRCLSVQAAFMAWKIDCWNADTYMELMATPVFDPERINRAPLKAFYISDKSFERFHKDSRDICRQVLDKLLEAGEYNKARRELWGVRPAAPSMELVLSFCEAIKSGEDAADVASFMTHVKLPEEHIDKAIEKLAQYDDKVLIAILQVKSEWIPIILEAMSDRKLAEVLKVFIGVFSQELIPKSLLNYGMYDTSLSSLYPGRSTSGYTKLGQILDVIDATPLSRIKKSLTILRAMNKTASVNEEVLVFIPYYAGMQVRGLEDDMTPSNYLTLSDRIRGDAKDREDLLHKRAEAYALDYYIKRANKTTDNEPCTSYMRIGMCAHAESAGFATMQDAMLDCARIWIEQSSLEVDGVVLSKCTESVDGIRIQKGKKTLKKLPKELVKNEQVIKFQAEAFMLWLTRKSFEQEVIQKYIETGEIINYESFTVVFGFSIDEYLTKRLGRLVPDALATEIRSLEVQGIDNPRVLECFQEVIPSKVFPDLIANGWVHNVEYSRYNVEPSKYIGIHSNYGGKGYVNLYLEIHPVDPREKPARGKNPPKTPHKLLVSTFGLYQTMDSTPEANQRIMNLILQDLTDALV